jgi:hypothetical protein
MKIFYSLCLLLCVAVASLHAQVKVIGSVVPNAATDKYPTHTDLYGKGGFRAVANTTERDAITPARRSEGMLVYCVADGKFYQLKAGILDANWVVADLGMGGGGGTASGTSANTPDMLVKRDLNGDFAAGMITANLTGNITGTAANVTGIVPLLNGGTGAATVAEARTNLELGTLSLQNANAVAITQGAIDGTNIGATTPATGAFTSLAASQGLGVTGNISATGNITANSDRRLKKNIRIIPHVSASLRKIEPVEFDRIDMNLHQLGFIAQNVQQYFPALVTVGTDKKATLSLNYQGMVSPLLKGWQEHDDEIIRLKKQVADMQKEIEELKQLMRRKK